jgi:hypothetical protein
LEKQPLSSGPSKVIFERTFITRRGLAWNYVYRRREDSPQLRQSFLSPRQRSTLIGICGVWLVIAAVWGLAPSAELWSDLVVGAIAAVGGLSITKYYLSSGIVGQTLGMWMMAAAFIPSLLSGEPLLANNVVVGILLMLAGFSVRGTPVGSGQAANNKASASDNKSSEDSSLDSAT